MFLPGTGFKGIQGGTLTAQDAPVLFSLPVRSAPSTIED